MFIAALFIIAKKWEEPKSSLTYEWIKKMWYIYTKEYYSAIKRMKNNICNDKEIIILSEVSQKEKDKYLMLSLTGRI